MALKNFAFKVLIKDKFARCGLIETHRGNINTPAFMPVGTQATVKACTIDDIKKIENDACLVIFQVFLYFINFPVVGISDVMGCLM